MKLTLKIHDVSAELDPAGDGIWIELPGQEPIRMSMSDDGAANLVRLAQTLAVAAEPREAPEWPDVYTEPVGITDAALGVDQVKP